MTDYSTWDKNDLEPRDPDEDEALDPEEDPVVSEEKMRSPKFQEVDHAGHQLYILQHDHVRDDQEVHFVHIAGGEEEQNRPTDPEETTNSVVRVHSYISENGKPYIPNRMV